MDRERTMKGLEIILNGCDEIQCEDCWFQIKEPAKPRRCGIDEEQIHQDALALLKEQEESIPVSWLTEKLEGHPELSYAVTDGINNVLALWEGR